MLIDCVSSPLMTSAQATGKIKLYQSAVGGVLLLNVPISYLILKAGNEPYTVVYVGIVLSVISFWFRLFLVNRLIGLPVKRYLKEVIVRGLLVLLVTIVMFNSIGFIIFKHIDNFWIVSTIASVSSLSAIFCFGLSSYEKNYFLGSVKSIFIKIICKISSKN